MKHRSFVTADPHFGHKGVTQFLQDHGPKLRPWDNTKDMDEALVQYWNETVKAEDTVYILGDFCINRRALPTAKLLNGRKILIKGNHDIFRLSEYAEYFADVRACQVWHGAIGTHIPIHPSQLDRFKHNIHGHLHANKVMYHDAHQSFPDENYTCVSVEQTDFRPINLDELLSSIGKRKAD